ncbi:U2 small nuclear ribonucleoprotein auxiliary factor 35 kDa subunit- protein 2 [Branchiostoma belcheri]|nr:U2 small nuclear ribonucleoprotein auxiliary factor 35 kDa subunit- protein 2 [Branchiostoma belcheri]
MTKYAPGCEPQGAGKHGAGFTWWRKRTKTTKTQPQTEESLVEEGEETKETSGRSKSKGRRVARDRQHQLWLEREARAQQEFRVRREREETRRREQEEQERLIREEWEEQQRKEKEAKERKEREKKEQEDKLNRMLASTGTSGNKKKEEWHNPIAPADYSAGGEVPAPTGRAAEDCPFFKKTGACRFGDRCSRKHTRPDTSTTLLIPGMFGTFALDQTQRDDFDETMYLEYGEDELYKDFIEFYNDALPEFRTLGRVIQFKVCCNHEPHLRGNVYVQYDREEDCLEAIKKFHGRFYAGRQLTCEMTPVTSWKSAICGLFSRKKCPKGKNCNFLHVFPNPGREFRDADEDLHLEGLRRDQHDSRRSWREFSERRGSVSSRATEESSKRERGGSRRRSSGKEREEGGTSPGGSAHHVRENDRHDSRQKSSSPAMPVLSAGGSQQEGDGEQKQPPTVQQDGNLPSDGDISSGGGDGSRKTHDSETEFSPTNVRISALEQSFASMSQRLEAFQELMLAQFEQSSPRKRRSARPETAVPEKRRKEDSASARSGKQRSPSHDGAEGESVSGDSGEHPAVAVPEKRRKEDSASARSGKQRSPSHDGAEGESVGGDSGASDSVWKPFDPTSKDTMHSWVADDVVFSEVEKYFKHDQQRRGTDLEAWQQKFSMPDNAPSTMVAPSFNDNIARAVVDNDKKQGEQIISHDKALKNIHSNLVHIGTPLMNLWQMIQRCNSENFEELQLEMSDCAGSALVLLGSLHSQLAFTRRTFIAESSQRKFRDLFKAASEDPEFLFPPDMGSKAKDLSSETKVLVGMLSQDDQGKSSVPRRGARRGGGRATGGGFSYSYRNSRYMPRANYGQYSYRGSQTRQFYNRNQSFQSKSGDGKQKQSK